MKKQETTTQTTCDGSTRPSDIARSSAPIVTAAMMRPGSTQAGYS